ncbi:transcription-repair coupling factor [Helicobacter sp. 10-6591]|uniref:transcription-repair coupling factor n=1 Tax=Helicobacter sp. 10-6591 TaxID=2004998 RepID=UPI000DCF5342|nr:transcription-repair coupling factor [Helicobacter sp. 10-6591]RAX56308.1 transcription-repair coupling factor [Helicobacter sp. 10-6591]
MIQAQVYSSFHKFDSPSLLALEDFQGARSAFAAFEFLYNHTEFTPISIPPKPFLLPEVRIHFGDDLSPFREDLLELLQVLRDFFRFQKNKILLAPISSILYPLPKAEFLESFVLSKQITITPQVLFEKLVGFGYESVEVVEVKGEISLRGEILDVFLPNSDKPHRICFFGDEVESIRVFDLHTQISIQEEFHTLEIPPTFFNFTQTGLTKSSEKYKFLEFLAKDMGDLTNENLIATYCLWTLGENGSLLHKTLTSFISDAALSQAKELQSLEIRQDCDFYQCALDSLQDFTLLDSKDSQTQEITFSPKMLDSLLNLHSNREIVLLVPNIAFAKSLGFQAIEHNTEYVRLYYPPASLEVRGIVCENVFNLLTPKRLFLSLNFFQPQKVLRKRRSRLNLNELNTGEYVVHEDYGIGIFKGIKSVSVLGVVRDFLEIAYQGDDKLLLPVDRLEVVERFVADSGNVPVIDRLGKGSFSKLKESVRKKLLEIASHIIELAANRALIPGIRIDCKNPALQQFIKQCPFKLTDDQTQSINEIFSDLESGRIMDRLLSGDVGFGKTEVAMVAMCAVVLQGYQCMFIVPTTLLCLQHFQTLSIRFSKMLKNDNKPLNIVKLDRFSNAKEKKQILQESKNGSIDILIGTHAVLGVEFANLGLVVIDEEHKFGVKQKEKIKSLCEQTHLLNMSATPIPRTLNMALSKIKSFSALRTPPLERKGVRTFVKTYNPNLICEVILRELRRGGQVFYLHNNIASMDSKYRELNKLLPKLKIAVLHSQVDSTDSENIMREFLAGKTQLLLCTSIVESGLHLPNANTIIIEEANRFGIADLHQLRGRVGRGDKEGFCYLLVSDEGMLSHDARKRLRALEKNSYLGSGENLAYHDLEIRGGGNLLGQAQSGHIKKIGYGLYLHMLEECINQLSGKGQKKKLQVDIKINLSAYLNPELIASDRLRLELYRRLCLCEDLNEVYEIEGEIENRFGKLDTLTLSFLELIRIRILANHLQIKQITHFGQNIAFIYENGEKKSLTSKSKDWDDVFGCIIQSLRQEIKTQDPTEFLGEKVF